MEKINVLYLHETSYISGAENSLLNLVKWLDKEKFRIFFVLSTNGLFAEALKSMGAQVHLVKLPKIRRLFGVFSAIKKIRKIVRGQKMHVLHSNSIRTHIYATAVARLEGLPVVWHQRNLITYERVDPDRLFSFLPDKIICNSFSISRRFIRKGKLPEKVAVVHNGVDTDKFSPEIDREDARGKLGIGKQEIIVGMASRFGLDKGQETFLKAAKLVVEAKGKSGRCRFLIVGDAVFEEDRWREKYLKEIAGDMGIGGRIIFTGFKLDMPAVYAAMDIFVLASYAEPCGRVILEAMSMGKPVVATNTGGTPEMVSDGENGILIPPQNEQAMAEAILSLIKDEDTARKMGQKGREKAEKRFNIEKNVEETEKIYLELVQR